MNSLAQHASQMLSAEDKPSLAMLPPLLRGSGSGSQYLPHANNNPTAQQLYMALLDIQMATSSAGHSPTPSSTSILLPVLSQQLAAHLSSYRSSSSPSTYSSSSSNKRTGAATSVATRQRGSKTNKQMTKRGRKTTGRVCAECNTDNTLQWRLGPDGQASLCNACGQRFQRRKQAMQQQQQFASPSTSSPACSPPWAQGNPNTAAKPADYAPMDKQAMACGSPPTERRSDIYSLLN